MMGEIKMNINWDRIFNNIGNWMFTSGLKLLIGLLVLWISFKFINFISYKINKKLIASTKLDVTVTSFLEPLIRKLLKFFILLAFVGYVGIETSSIIAAITGAGVGIGLALQGALSNLAGGLIILFMRPFRVGDYITVCGESGTVETIQIFYTTMVTIDNRVIMVPNGKVVDDTIINVSVKKTRRVDLAFTISYKNDYDFVKSIILECINKSELALKNNVPFITINNYKDSYLEIGVRVWVKNKDYWDFYYKILEDIEYAFKKNKIEVPYSKVDIEIMNNR